MGTFGVSVVVTGPDGRAIDVDALVDMGATRTLLPGRALREIGVEPIDRIEFQLAGRAGGGVRRG